MTTGRIQRPTEQGIRGRTDRRLDDLERRVQWRQGESLPTSQLGTRVAMPNASSSVTLTTLYQQVVTGSIDVEVAGVLDVRSVLAIAGSATGWGTVVSIVLIDGIAIFRETVVGDNGLAVQRHQLINEVGTTQPALVGTIPFSVEARKTVNAGTVVASGGVVSWMTATFFPS